MTQVRPRLRVLVKGASTVSWISWMGGPRSDLAFPRALELELGRRGIAADVRNTAVLGTPTSSFFATFEADVAQWSPDVIVIVAGHYETIHSFLPRRFERHANRPNFRPGPFRERYRKRYVRGAWKLLATLQSKVDRPELTPRLDRRLRRAARDLDGYIRLVRQVGSPLVVVFELLVPAPRQQQWFPGMAGRIRRINELHRGVVAAYDDPSIRTFAPEPLARARYGDDPAAATPDGFHFTPDLHRDIAVGLADQITDWLRTQRHLEG